MKTVICAVILGAISVATTASAQGPPTPIPAPSMPVTIMNTPLPVTGTVSGSVNATIVGTPEVRIATGHVAFTKRLCIPNFCTPASPSSFTVPGTTAGGQTVKELAIDFVTGLCTGTGRIGEVFLEAANGTQTIADTGDNFSRNVFPASVSQYNSALGLNGSQSFSQQTNITYSPGTVVSTTYTILQAGENFCRVQLNGHFVTTP